MVAGVLQNLADLTALFAIAKHSDNLSTLFLILKKNFISPDRFDGQKAH